MSGVMCVAEAMSVAAGEHVTTLPNILSGKDVFGAHLAHADQGDTIPHVVPLTNVHEPVHTFEILGCVGPRSRAVRDVALP